MNYRHAYHAGNFADVLKHVVLALCLDYLQRKDGALCVIDTHGGAGIYDLASEEAQKTGEWERGIGALEAALGGATPDAIETLTPYLNLVREDMARGTYPGSPLLIARRLRPQDRLLTAELHPPTFDALENTLSPYRNARPMHMDAYECARAHIPPKERRGLALIDPPFEEKDEFETLCRQMREWRKRWATGVYLIWYPIKQHLPVIALHDAARELGMPRTWYAETLVLPRSRADALTGCGVIVFNAPFSVPERIEALLPFFKSAMVLHETASGWFVPPT
jgi:23S rRNA (adenine2030-N6)-methyltransferase